MRIQLSRLRARWAGQDGAAAVEMALLSLFVLVPLVFAVIEFGTIFAQDLGMGNGAREGARFAASTPTLECDNAADDDLIEMIRNATETILLDRQMGSDEISRVSIRVSVGSDLDSSSVVCGVDPGGLWTSDLPPPGPTDVAVCEDSPSGTRVFVESKWARGIGIPLGPTATDFKVNGKGVFVCEYS